MQAHVGDQISIRAHQVGELDRYGEIIEVRGPEGQPPGGRPVGRLRPRGPVPSRGGRGGGAPRREPGRALIRLLPVIGRLRLSPRPMWW